MAPMLRAVWLGGLALAALAYGWPAQAQFFPFDDRFFGFPRPQKPRPPVQDSTVAPPPKKVEVPPTIRILVLGDSMADWLAYGLEEQLAETPEIGIVRKHRALSGLIRYDQKNETDWPKVARDLIAAEKPQAVIVLVGLQDRQDIRERAPAKPHSQHKPGATGQQPAQAGAGQPQQPAETNDDETPSIASPEPQRVRPSGPVEFRSERWEELYGAKVDEMLAAVRTANVPVLWVGVPAVRGAKSTADLQYLNDIIRPRVEKAGFIFVNVWDGFVDERGNFMQRGPDETGQIRVLRTQDGVHFTRFGARKLAHYVERDLKRVLREPIPAALSNVPVDPQPAQPAKPSGPAARPLAGPVILLGTPLQEPTDLAGGTPAPAAKAGPPLDAVATRILVKGEPQRSEPGRADDPAWPPRMPNLVAAEPLPPTTAPLAIVRAPAPGTVQQAALPGQKPGMPGAPGQRIAGQQPQLQGARQQQAPTFWRRPAFESSGPRFFFGLFGR
ncbi:MAG: DUF459 domain-containing protein [Pseudomonadota bacterium]